MYHLTELLGLPIFGPTGARQGKLRDAVIEPASDPRLVQMVLFRQDRQWWQLPARFASLSLHGLRLLPDAPPPQPWTSGPAHLMLCRDVLDQQILDVNGRKVVRVNDVGFELHRVAGQLSIRAAEVDVGVSGALRRLLQGVVPRPWLSRAAHWSASRRIPWNVFNLIEADPARRVKLQITYQDLASLHPADVADIVEDLSPAERGAVLESLTDEVAADVLGEIEPRLQRSIVESLATGKAADIVEEMDPDQAADLLADLSHETSREILRDMQAEERAEVSDLLGFPEDTAGGRMTTDLLALPAEATVADVGPALRRFEGPVEALNTLFLVDDQHRLLASVPLARILLVPAETRLAALGVEPVTVEADEKDSAIIARFDKYNLLALPVLDRERRLLGMVTADDVISLLRSRS